MNKAANDLFSTPINSILVTENTTSYEDLLSMEGSEAEEHDAIFTKGGELTEGVSSSIPSLYRPLDRQRWEIRLIRLRYSASNITKSRDQRFESEWHCERDRYPIGNWADPSNEDDENDLDCKKMNMRLAMR